MKRVFFILCILALILIGKNAISADQINIGTNPIGAFYHAIGVAAAKVISS